MLNGYPTILHKDALLHHFPSDWKLSRIGNVCEIRNTLRKPLSDEERQLMQGPFPYYGPTSQVDSIAEYRLDGTYALIGEDGDHFLKYDRMSMTQFITGKCNVNNHAHIIEGTSSCLTEWVFHFFRHRNILHFLSRQGAGRYKLNKAALAKLPILLPPVPEQQKIAAILSTWDRAIELAEKLIAAKQKRKQALMQQLLTGKVRFAEFVKSDAVFPTRYGNYPKDWEYVKIEKVAKEVSERNTDGASHQVLSCTKYDGLVDSLTYFGKQIFSEDLSTYKIVRRNHFAYATNHIEEGSIGYQDVSESAVISPMYTVFKTQNNVDDGFLYKLLKSDRYVHIYQVNTSASVDRRGSLRWTAFAHIRIPLPSLEEQRAIAAVLDGQQQEIDLLKRKCETLKQQKKGLMQQLLTGKVRVNVNATQPEEVLL